MQGGNTWCKPVAGSRSSFTSVLETIWKEGGFPTSATSAVISLLSPHDPWCTVSFTTKFHRACKKSLSFPSCCLFAGGVSGGPKVMQDGICTGRRLQGAKGKLIFH